MSDGYPVEENDAASRQYGPQEALLLPDGRLGCGARGDGPLCRLTLAWIVFHSWRTSVSWPLSHWSDSAALFFRPRSDKQLGVSGT